MYFQSLTWNTKPTKPNLATICICFAQPEDFFVAFLIKTAGLVWYFSTTLKYILSHNLIGFSWKQSPGHINVQTIGLPAVNPD